MHGGGSSSGPVAAQRPRAGLLAPSEPKHGATAATPPRLTLPPIVHRRRIYYSLVSIGIVLALGTLGLYAFTGSGWVNSFYFECMLATGQGPPFPLTTTGSKLFAAFMAFVSIGTVLTTLVLNLGPIIARFWRNEIERVEHDFRNIEREVSEEFHRRDPP